MATKTHLGLEINDKEIRYVELYKKGAALELGRYGEIKLPEGMIASGSIQQGLKLLGILEALNKKLKCKDVSVAYIPGQVYLVDILLEAKFKNIAFEKAGEALARAAIPRKSAETDMFVYFAGGAMNIYIGSRSGAKLLSTSNFSSGLLSRMEDKELIYSFIKEKIDEQYISWHTHKDEKPRAKVSKIILAGEIAEPEALAGYLTKSLKVRTELAQVWTNLFSFDESIPEINFRDSLRYAVAVGLAARLFEK